MSISSVLFTVSSMTTTEFLIKETGSWVMFQKLVGRAFKNMIMVCANEIYVTRESHSADIFTYMCPTDIVSYPQIENRIILIVNPAFENTI